jgi:hypothetical protein
MGRLFSKHATAAYSASARWGPIGEYHGIDPASACGWLIPAMLYASSPKLRETVMSKGMDSKKNVKKKATKTLKEKREAKKAKKS